MSKITLSGIWNKIHGKIKQQYGLLMDNDRIYKNGMHDELLGSLQIRIGRSKGDIIKIILTEI